MKLLTPSHALSPRSYQLRSSPVRVEALNLTTDTVTILSLFGPTGKRGACGSTCRTPFCSFPANSSFQHGHTDHMRNSVDYYHSNT